VRVLGRMSEGHVDTPRWISAILEWPYLGFLARLGLTSAYLLGGAVKLSNFPAAMAEQAHFGLNPPWLWAGAAIIVELGGSLLVLSGRFVWLGAGALGVLTTIVTVAAKPFWQLSGAAAFSAFNAALEDLGLVAGFVLVAIQAERSQRQRREDYGLDARHQRS
jgi:uncharacterized membrane protein YphA (DoxX/SURF4 family)